MVEDICDDIKSMALVDCLNHFKPELNKQFSTYYIWWVRKRLNMRNMRNTRVRRSNNGIISLNVPLMNKKGDDVSLENVLTNFNVNVKHSFKSYIKKELSKINLDRIKNS